MTGPESTASGEIQIDSESQGRLLMLVLGGVGLVAGLLFAGLTEVWTEEGRLPVLVFTALSAVTYGVMLVWSPDRPAGGLAVTAMLTAAFLAVSWIADAPTPPDGIWEPDWAWLFLGLPWCSFVAFILGRTLVDAGGLPYPRVYATGFAMTLQLIIGYVFLGLIWGFFWLWAALFDAIGVDFLVTLIQDEWFIFPVSGLLIGIGIGVARQWGAVVGVMRNIARYLAWVAVPLSTAFALTYLIALAIQGFDPLFETGIPVIIAVTTVLVAQFIFNFLYQDGMRPPPRWLQVVSLVLVLTLPVYGALGVWAAWEHERANGLTPGFIVGLTVIAIAAAGAVFYFLALVRRPLTDGAPWLPLLGPVNILLTGGFAVLMIGLQFVDRWQIAAGSQVARLAEGRVSAEEFPYREVDRWGPVGAAALDRVLEMRDHPEYDVIQQKIEELRTPAEPVFPDFDSGSETGDDSAPDGGTTADETETGEAPPQEP